MESLLKAKETQLIRSKIIGYHQRLSVGEIKYFEGRWLHRCAGCLKIIGLPKHEVTGPLDAPTVEPGVNCPLCGARYKILDGEIKWK